MALVLALGVGGGEAQAGFRSGNALLAECGGEGVELAFCQGYIAGIVDVMWAGGGNSVNGFRSCTPSSGGIRIRQMVDIVKQYLERTPKDRHLAAEGLVAEAIRLAFPCPR